MRHDCSVRGLAFGLRPVTLDDAEFIVQLRKSTARTRFLNRGAETVETQREWLDRYFHREGDYYFVVHDAANGAPEGLIGVYDLSDARHEAEWGRWVLVPGSAAAVESAWLVYRWIFDKMLLDRTFCRTLRANAQVISFHDSCGLRRTSTPVMVHIDGDLQPAVEHVIERGQWPKVEVQLSRLARRIHEVRSMRRANASV